MADETYNVIFDAGINAHLQNSQNLQKEVESSITQGAKGAEASLTKTFANAASGSLWSRKQERLQQGENKGLARMSADDARQQYYGLIKRASTVDDWRKIMDKAKPTFEDYKWANTPMNSPAEWDASEMYAKYDAQAKIEAYNTAQMHYEAMLAKIEAKSGETATRVGGFFKAAFKGVGKFASDVFTRMRNQLIRQIARQLLNLGKEGLKLLVNWDRNFGNNTSHAAETMDHLSAKWTELKKSIGAAFMPIIQILQPIIDGAIDLVISLFNTINQIARTIQGYGTYMKATYKVTKQTTGAAKELKRVLFGFDELNILPSDTGSGASSSVNINDFIPTLIDSSVTDAVNRIKNWKETLANAGENAEADLEVNPYINPRVMESFDEKVRRKLKEVFHIDDADIENANRAINEGFGQAVDDLKENWENLKTNVSEALDRWKKSFNKIGSWLRQNIMIPVRQATADFYEWMLREHPKLAKFLGITQEELDTIRVEIDVLTQMDKDSNELIGSIVTSAANVSLRTGLNVTSTLDQSTSDLLYSPLSGGNSALAANISVGASISSAAQQLLDASAFKAYDTHFNATIATAANLSPDTRALMASSIARAASNTFWLNFKTDTYLSPDTRKLWEVVASAGAMSASIGAQIAIRGYASGGSIANRGSLILANEAGPEVVANMGGATGIMNTSQMEAAIANGNTAVVAALYDIANDVIRTINNKDMDVLLDGRKVGESVSKYQNNYSRSFGV